MRTVIVIPSRYGSSRFPGKPLALIAGHSLVERVWRNAKRVSGVDEVIVTTDDSRIEEAASRFGATVVRTSESCRNGTERVFEAVRALPVRPEIVINMQGDTPLTPPWFVDPLIALMTRDSSVQLATPALRLTPESLSKVLSEKPGLHGGTYVACDVNCKALYFSRYPIPFIRPDSKPLNPEGPPVFKHIGIYAFRYTTLERFVSLAPTPLESAEQLEQLRALENGIPIHVAEVSARGRSIRSVDTPEDARQVEQIIAREGELQ